MQFNSHATSQDLVSDTLYWASADSTSYAIADITRSINFALDKYTSYIIGADANWEFDDSNNTTLPIGVTNLVSGQARYTFDPTVLNVKRIEWMDENGNWIKGKPLDEKEIPIALDEFMKTSGIPIYYDKTADSITLYPAPNYNSTKGLKVRFQRAIGHFATTDTTKEPGFAQPFHRLLSLSAGRDYAVLYKPERVAIIDKEIGKLEMKLEEHYGRRAKDTKKKLVAKSVCAE